jgi:Tol biopolymer transport system component/DNA-binding winged helix-turn-helix (wHTH) protein
MVNFSAPSAECFNLGSPFNGRQRLRFGLFEVDLASGELYKHGRLVHVQEQPFRILAMLLERPGEVVSREEVQKKLWPEGTFVDFDESLDTALKKLRHALGDSSQNPIFVETIPRRGYRFIAPVEALDNSPDQEERDKVLKKDGGLRAQWAIDLRTDLTHHKEETESERAAVEHSVAPEADLNLALTEIAETGSQLVVHAPAPGVRKYRERVAWTLAAVLFVLAAASGLGYLSRVRGPERAMHFSVPLPLPMRDLVLSHNGRMLAFVAPPPREGGARLWVHGVGASGARLLENTEGASYPFWSPDNKFIAFFADGKLKKIEAAGGPVEVICDAPIGRGGTWGRDGVIVFARDTGVAIYRVSAAGGEVTLVNGFERKIATTMSSRWPVFLPDGKHFLYSSVDFGTDLRGETGAIYVAALDSREHRRLVMSNSNAAYIPPGYLLFLRNGKLMAQPFDTERLQVTGEAFAVANGVEYLSSVARALFSASGNGTLVYQTGSGATFSQLAWFDREGKQLSTLGAPARYANPRLSPDGKRVAADIDDPQSSNTDIWVFEPNHHVPSRITFDPGQDEAPLWSHDGRSILWLSDRGGKNSFYVKAYDESGIEKALTASMGVNLSFASAPSDWSSDGRFLLYTDLQEGTVLHLWVMPMTGDRKPYRFLSGDAADVEGQFSPDGDCVAYSSNESGRWQVYVAAFPGPGGKYQISTDGGQQPRWRRDGKELFFLSRDRRLMAVSVKAGAKFEFTGPTPLFETQAHEPITAEEFFTYDTSPDGQRFLINVNVEQENPPPVDIILNWATQLKK